MTFIMPYTTTEKYNSTFAETDASNLADTIRNKVKNDNHPVIWAFELGFPEFLKNAMDAKISDNIFDAQTYLTIEVEESDENFTITIKDQYAGFHYTPRTDDEKNDQHYLDCLQDLENGKIIDYKDILRNKNKTISAKTAEEKQLGGRGLGISTIEKLLNLFQGKVSIKNNIATTPNATAKHACVTLTAPIDCVLDLTENNSERAARLAETYTHLYSLKSPQYFPKTPMTSPRLTFRSFISSMMSAITPKPPVTTIEKGKGKLHFGSLSLTDDAAEEIQVISKHKPG